MGLLGKKYKNSEEIFAEVANHENRKKLEALLYKMIEDGVDDENFRREDLIVLEAMNTLAEKVDLCYIGGVSERLKKLLLPLMHQREWIRFTTQFFKMMVIKCILWINW